MNAHRHERPPARAADGALTGEFRDYLCLSREYIPAVLGMQEMPHCALRLVLFIWQHSYGLREPQRLSMVTRDHITPILGMARQTWWKGLRWLLSNRVIVEDPKSGQLGCNTNLDEWVGMNKTVRANNRLPGGRLTGYVRLRTGRQGTSAQGESAGVQVGSSLVPNAQNSHPDSPSARASTDGNRPDSVTRSAKEPSLTLRNGTTTGQGASLTPRNGTLTGHRGATSSSKRDAMVPPTAPMGAANGTITGDAREQEQEHPSPTPPTGDPSLVGVSPSEQEDLESGDAASSGQDPERGYRLPREFQRRRRRARPAARALPPAVITIYDRPKVTEFTPADPFGDPDPPTDWRRRVVRAAIGYLSRYFRTDLARDAAVILAAEIDRDGLKRGMAVPAARDPSRFADACDGVCAAQREFELGRQDTRVLCPVRALHAAYFKAREAQRPFPPSLREGTLLVRWKFLHGEGTLPLPPLEARHHDEFERRTKIAESARKAEPSRVLTQLNPLRRVYERASAELRAEQQAAELSGWTSFVAAIGNVSSARLIEWHAERTAKTGTAGGGLAAHRLNNLRAWDAAGRPASGPIAEAARRAFNDAPAAEVRGAAADEAKARELRAVVIEALNTVRAAVGVKNALDGIPVAIASGFHAALGEQDGAAVVQALKDPRSVSLLALAQLEHLRDALARFARLCSTARPP